MLLPLAYYGNPILRKKGARVNEINDELRQLVADMIETMRKTNGIGIAAPQVHKSLALFVTEVPIKASDDPEDDEWLPGEVRVFINPKILSHSEEKWHRGEGCLSIPGVYGIVERPITIRVRATDLEGNEFEEDLSWLDARAVMHENDHINGVLYIDRMLPNDRKALEEKLMQIKRRYHS